MAKKQKYYVVWKGHKSGVYSDWQTCEQQIKGFPEAQYKSFESLQAAEKAFTEKAEKHIYKNAEAVQSKEAMQLYAGKPVWESISVDAACNMQKGIMEYQGVFTHNKQLIFKQGPFKDSTNNIGEFLALVHALAHCKKHNISLPIYSDSVTAIKWVKKKKAATKQEETDLNAEVFDLIHRAENWLQKNTWENKILKWETEFWGEIPADFGRK